MGLRVFRRPRHEDRLLRLWRTHLRRVATIVAVIATLLTASVASADDGGGTGSGGGGSDGGSKSASLQWKYKESWPASEAGVRQAIAEMGVTVPAWVSKYVSIQGVVDQAVAQCKSSYTGSDAPDCRMVAVGIVRLGDNTFDGSGVGFSAAQWTSAWGAETAGKSYAHGGRSYTTATTWRDKLGTRSVNSMVQGDVAGNPSATLRVVVLAHNQPANPDYTLRVTTSQSSPAGLKVGSTAAVHDVVHASNDEGTRERLNASVILHFDGNAYVPAASKAKSVTIASQGDTGSPTFAPSDFGWSHWPAGRHWFDVQVPKQGRMAAAVDTTDRQASESFLVSAVPPDKPAKGIEQGTSADRMVNRTTISTGTGRGGYEMTIRDRITPNGVDYSIGNYRLVDTSDGNRDVSGEFTITWDRQTNTVSAVRAKSKGEMPLDHTYAFGFDVTVSKPDFSKMRDVASVTWNQEPGADTDGHEFPTWRPNPDKSWIKQDTRGRWQAVIDPGRTNATGADDASFLDGDRVASVVNATVAADLIEKPDSFVISDDWGKAAYLFEADGAKTLRVYEADATSGTRSSVADITATGRDVTDQFTITVTGTGAVATAKPAYLAGLKGLDAPRQVTLLIPGTVRLAHGKGAAQVRSDFHKDAGQEVAFCVNPAGDNLSNAGSESVNTHTVATNEPRICAYIPPAVKDVIGEASQGGDQASVDGKVVYPGQRVEYQLLTEPKLPSTLAYAVTSVTFTDSYDQYLTPDKQTLELMDLTTGKTIPKSKYATTWDDSGHMVAMRITDRATIAGWKAGSNPRIQLRFEGTVRKDAPTGHRVGNRWVLTVNNALTPSNEVFTIPPDLRPSKEDRQSSTQGDPSVSIDGRTLLLGDTGTYLVNLYATQTNQAYGVWRLGVVDDYDKRYVAVDQSRIAVIGADGRDYTSRFNIQIRDGVAYVFAKTVDTSVPATGEIVKGDPQPQDLAAYAGLGEQDHDALKDPGIDQSLLGQTYQVLLPYTVVKVTDGVVVTNTATQVTNGVRTATNQVSNPLTPINPTKDVVVRVGGDSVSGHSIYLNSTFLYRLDSSAIPKDRAYPLVDRWSIGDRLNPKVDRFTGLWVVYAAKDLYEQGKVIASKGEKIAGSGFDSGRLGGDLFTLTSQEDGTLQIAATGRYRTLISADNQHVQAWTAYVQVKRIAVTARQDNRFTERFNDKVLPSNTVWTRTPDLTPGLHLEKWDKDSGWPTGDRDDSKNALAGAKDGDIIVFTITNTSRSDDGKGAWFKASDLKLTDHTIVGDGTVNNLKYPAGWNTLVLKPGQRVEVTGTLTGFIAGRHTDRAQVTGTPLTPCPTTDTDPFSDKGTTTRDSTPKDAVHMEGETRCPDTSVTSNLDDWNGRVAPKLATTGTTVAVIAITAVAVCLAGGILLIVVRRRTTRPARER